MRGLAPRSIAAGCRWRRWPDVSALRFTFTRPTRLWSGCDCSSEALAGRDHLVCYAVKANSALAILKLLGGSRRGIRHCLRRRTGARAGCRAGGCGARGLFRRGQNGGGDRPGAEGRNSAVQRGERGRAGSARRARAKAQVQARFALRVNPDVFAETHPYISTGLREHKFGIDIRQRPAIYKKRGGQSLARGARRQRAHRLADSLRRSVWRGDRAGEQAGAPAAARRHRDRGRSMPAAGWESIITAGAFDAAAKVRSMRRRLSMRWANSTVSCSLSRDGSWWRRPARS